MASPRLKIGISVGIVAGLFAIAYFDARPNWRTITDAELTAILHPDLKQPLSNDLEAQARLERFRIQLNTYLADHRPAANNNHNVVPRVLEGDPSLKQIEKILAEGPLQSPAISASYRKWWSKDPMVDIACGYARAAGTQYRAYDVSGATRNCLIAIRLADEVANVVTDWHELPMQSGVYEELGRVLLDPKLAIPERDLGIVANALPTVTLEDRVLRKFLIQNCQGVFPALVDPVTEVRRISPEMDPEKLLSRFVSGNFAGPENSAVATYDALETVRDVNKVMLPALRNTGRSFSDQDRTLYGYGNGLTASYPSNGAAGKSGAEGWFAKMRYRWATARVRNGLGNQVISMLCNSIENIPEEASFLRRAKLESLRTRIALRRYQLRHGNRAPSLGALVEEGLLPNLPIDLYDGKRLRYDPQRKLLWSVGKDGRDDGGNSPSTDLLWQIR